MPKNRMQAKVAPPAAYHGTPSRLGLTRVALVAGVVEMVREAVPGAVPLMLTGLVEPKLNVGASEPPAGLDVMAAVSAILPVNPPAGVTVMVEVFAVVAPGATMTAVPLIVKPGGIGVVTITEVVAELGL
jgi:hypothetical protein